MNPLSIFIRIFLFKWYHQLVLLLVFCFNFGQVIDSVSYLWVVIR